MPKTRNFVMSKLFKHLFELWQHDSTMTLVPALSEDRHLLAYYILGFDKVLLSLSGMLELSFRTLWGQEFTSRKSEQDVCTRLVRLGI